MHEQLAEKHDTNSGFYPLIQNIHTYIAIVSLIFIFNISGEEEEERKM
jgi:hypothetical protein